MNLCSNPTVLQRFFYHLYFLLQSWVLDILAMVLHKRLIFFPNTHDWYNMFFPSLNNRLDVYIHDYLVKRDLKASAQAFQAEGKVSSDPVGKYIWKHENNDVGKQRTFPFWGSFSLNFERDFDWFKLLEHEFTAIDAPGGFLFEWWSVFWDIFIARTNEKHSEVAASYIEVGLRIFCYWYFNILP
jgi:hypothetical protein